MKALMLNGSPKADGNTARALKEAGRILEENGIDYEVFEIGAGPVRDCIGCRACNESGCVFTDDGVNAFIAKAKEADGLVFGTPVYYAHPSGRILSFLDRVFYSSPGLFAGKPGFALAVPRRAGATASLDVLGKYFGISGMINVGSTYWNVVYGRIPGEIVQDEEGMRSIRNASRNLAWVIKLIKLGDENGLARPEPERGLPTHFIR
ncbi:MAG: flavodoxin family protein [Lachnospiraceae bacterium]|jgi:multimeric flavodoxin WrbA